MHLGKPVTEALAGLISLLDTRKFFLSICNFHAQSRDFQYLRDVDCCLRISLIIAKPIFSGMLMTLGRQKLEKEFRVKRVRIGMPSSNLNLKRFRNPDSVAMMFEVQDMKCSKSSNPLARRLSIIEWRVPVEFRRSEVRPRN